MIHIKNSLQISAMKDAGRITGEALLLSRELVRPGITTYELDEALGKYIRKCGAIPTCLGYGGFPANACISINDEVIHGIPSKRKVLKEGDIVKVDLCATYHGYVGDSARTLPVGTISPVAQKLIDVTRASFYKGLEQIQIGNRLGDLGAAIDEYVVANGFSTVKRYVGHGIGTEMHESPDVPNYGTRGRGTRICAGLTIAVEPMVNVGSDEVVDLDDGWTVKTRDHSLSAHYENTVAVTSDGVILTTLVDKDF